MIDEKLQAELRAKYNPDGSLLRRHQLRMVEMLKYFDELCQKHGIRYWLSSGNCIGVARHGGFIPWDDDIDVEMLREDYLKLEKVFKETDDYVLQTWKNDPGYFVPFAKMRDKKSFIQEDGYDEFYKYRGVFIDVFCLDYSPRRICTIYKILVWKYLIDLSKEKRLVFRLPFYILKYILFISRPICRFLFGWLPNNKLRHIYGTGFENNIRNVKEIFPLQRAIFEGINVYVPNNLDAYLSKIYGDYMSIPAEDKRIKPHAKSVSIY